MLLEGKKVFVGPFLKRTDRPADKEAHYTNIYVKNLAESVTEEQLDAMFGEYGKVGCGPYSRGSAGYTVHCAPCAVLMLCLQHLHPHLVTPRDRESCRRSVSQVLCFKRFRVWTRTSGRAEMLITCVCSCAGDQLHDHEG